MTIATTGCILRSEKGHYIGIGKRLRRGINTQSGPHCYTGGMVREFFEGGATVGSIEGILALVIGIAVMFFVPALVWALTIAGLVRIVREKARESRSVQTAPSQEAQPLLGSN